MSRKPTEVKSGITSYLGYIKRVVNRFFRIRDFPYSGLGIRDLKAKSGRDSGLEVAQEVGWQKQPSGLRD